MEFAESVVRQFRLPNALPAVSSAFVGYLASYRGDYGEKAYRSLALLAVLLFAVHAAVTLANDLADRDVDRANKVKSALQRGVVSAQDLRVIMIALYGVSCIAWWLLGHSDELVYGIVALLALSWAYNQPPLQYSRRPLASIVLMGILFGGINVYLGSVTAGSTVHASLLWLAGAYTCLRASTSILKDYKDAEGDQQCGKRTFLLAYGAKSTKLSSLWLAVLGYVVLVAHGVIVWRSDFSLVKALLLVGMGVLMTWAVWLRLRLGVKPWDYTRNTALFIRMHWLALALDGGVIAWFCI